MKGTITDRFWAKVNKTETCWLWTGKQRYGSIENEGVRFSAHRLSWELANGAIPAGLHVLHRCDTPLCVRPDHLFTGTHAENMADMTAKGRRPKGEAHGRSKLTEADVLEIRRRRATGEPLHSIGKAFGVDHSTIQDVVSGRTWRHVSNQHKEQ